MIRSSRLLAALVASLAAAAVLAPSASAAPYNCPGTFEVLHNDRIGGMQLPKGPYVVTVLDSASMGCTEASRLFTEFLEDWDGRLPRPWVATNSTRTFRFGGGSSEGFRVTPAEQSPPPTPPHPPSRRVCPGYFTVLHNDRIGSFNIPAGDYRITLLSYRGVGCARAVRYLQKFLQDWDGDLPSPWHLDPGTGTFQRGHRTSASGSSPTSTPMKTGRAGTRAAVSRSAPRRSGCSTTTASANSSSRGAPTTCGSRG